MSSSSDPAAAAAAAAWEEWLTLLGQNRSANYAYASALAFISYDIILSLGQEVRYIWGSKWSLVKALYLMIRYLSIINLIPLLALFTRPNSDLSERVCKSNFLLIVSGPPIFAAIVDMILMLRIWALYGRSRALLIVFSALILGNFIAATWAAVEYGLNLNANLITMPDPWRGCTSSNPRMDSVLLVYIPNIVLSCLFLAMTLRKMIQNQELYGMGFWESLRNMKIISPLLLSFVRDGSMFFALAWLANFLGVLGAFIIKGVLASVLYPWTIALYSYSGAHLILNLRAAGAADGSQSISDMPNLDYSHNQSVSRGITFS